MPDAKSTAGALDISIALGVTAWFLPPETGAFAAATALFLALATTATRLPTRSYARWPTSRPNVGEVDADIARLEAELDDSDSDSDPDADRFRDTFSRIVGRSLILTTVVRAAVTVRGKIPPSAINRLIAANESQIRSQAALLTEISRLNSQVSELSAALKEIEERSRRSNILSFWGGVAISIPVGVLINLATG
jgi:hypothetical protein